MSNIVSRFIVLSTIFVLVHYVAVQTALYWTYAWFDIVMHFWGGILLALGAYTLGTVGLLKQQPRKREIFLLSFVVIITWEIFEQSAGIVSAPVYILDTIKDIIVGLCGVLVGHLVLRRK